MRQETRLAKREPRPLLAHLDRIRRRLEASSPAQQWAFAVASAERQWPIYARAAQGRPWDHRPALRAVLDRMWGWVGGRTPRPQDLATACREAQFVDRIGERPDLTYELANDAEAAADNVLTVLEVMAVGIGEDHTYGWFAPVQQAMSTVEAFVYEYELPELKVCADNDLVVDEHDLVQNAMHQQNDDLAMVTGSPDVRAVVGELRRQASAQGVLMDKWYR